MIQTSPIETGPIIEVNHLKNFLGERWIHTDVNFSVEKGEIVAIIGGSGSGKTTLIRSLLMLTPPTEGKVKIFGRDIYDGFSEVLAIKKRWGVLFQMNALFSSMTVLENILFPIKQYTSIEQALLKEIGILKINLVGLDQQVAYQYPAELSGGMQKRAALARAIALDPELIFLDEPTAGLDPSSATAIDELVLELRKHLGVTFVIATHDLDTLWHVSDRVLFLGEGKVIAIAPISELVKMPHPLIQQYFCGYRGRSKSTT